jgi:quercetin dioxygenase-like cupin family protein
MMDDELKSVEELLDDALAGAIRPVEPPAARQAALRARVLARVQPAAAGLRTVRAAEPGWIPTTPLTAVRELRAEAGASHRTVMFRLDPGGEIPAHSHRFEEETCVLDGEIEIGDEVLRAGDYQFAAPGSYHQTIRSPRGATLLIRFQTRA